jgi:ABC-type phosphate/phosphonate transport system permease subunit
VIGFVGAGGIGEELNKVISFNYYEEISAIIVLIVLRGVADRHDLRASAHGA